MENHLSQAAHLKVEYRECRSLVPYANNARKHPRSQIKLIAESLDKFGWTNPILVGSDGVILCGHGRYEAALLRGLKEVPTICLESLTEADRRAYIIADNATAEKSGWSKQTLAGELRGLLEIGYELKFTALDDLVIDTLLVLDDQDGTNADDVELPADDIRPVSRIGDLWQIGEHKLYVGDARAQDSYKSLLDSERAQLVVMDPPYGIPGSRISGGGRTVHEDFVMGSGRESIPELARILFEPTFERVAEVSQAGAIAYMFTDWRAAPHMLAAAETSFHETKQLIVWAKTNGGQGAFYRSAHELIYAFKVNPGEHINNFGMGKGGRYRTNVWTYPGANVFRKGRQQDLDDHPTIKNKKMISDAILDCSSPGGLVLDPFLGSGTTICAAARTGRRGRGIELDPKYADIALKRVAAETGLLPMLDGTPFADVRSDRLTRETSHGE